MRFEELSEDGAAELDQYILHLGQVSLALRLSQNAKADLHSLDVVTVGAHGSNLSFLRLVLLEKSANDEN